MFLFNNFDKITTNKIEKYKNSKEQRKQLHNQKFKRDSKAKQFIILQKKSGAMNIETYQNCIKTLENEIKSREQQRQSMQNTIMALDRDFGIEIERNKTMRDELMYLAQTNQNIINGLHKLQQVVREKDAVIEDRVVADEGRRLYIEALEREKVGLVEEVKQRDFVIGQKNEQFLKKENQLKVVLQSIKGYEYRLKLKAVEMTQISSKLHQYEEECVQLNQKLVKVQKQHQQQRKQLVEKLVKTQGSASTILSQQQLKIQQLQTQLQQAKQFYTDQVATLQFNKQSQVTQLNKRISSLQNKITYLEQQIVHLKQQQTKLKSHYQVQIQNNDKVVNTLINEINFLKQEKAQLKRRSSKTIQETAQKFLMMELEKQQKQERAKAAEIQIKTLKEQLYMKEKETVTLAKEIEKLNLQVEIANKESLGEKDTVLRKNEQIAELKRFIDNLKKFAQVADKEKQSFAQKTSKQLSTLRDQNQQLTTKLQLTIQQLQQLRITSSQLQQTNKFLSMQKHSTTSSVTQLQNLVKTHEYTIEKLQNMLEQTKKVVVDLNKLMKTKLAEVESLEMSNNLFRKEKVEWIKKQEEYRRKIGECKAIISVGRKVNLNQTSFMSKARRSVSQKDNISSNNSLRQRAQSMVVANVNQSGLSATPSSYAQSAMRRKTMTPSNLSQKPKNTNYTDHNNNYISSQCSSGNQQPIQGIPTLPLVLNAFKKPQTFKTKQKSVDSTEIPIQAPVIPVLIAMKREEENKMDLSCDGVNGLEKEERVGWEGLSENVIEALKLNTSPRSPLSDRKNECNKEEGQVQKTSQTNKLPASSQYPQSQSPIQPITKPLPQTLQQNDKQISTSTYPQTPSFKDKLQPTIQARSQHMTPEFHIQSEEQNLQEKQQEQNAQENLTQGYQTLQEYEEEQRRMAIPKKISPINSRVLIKQDRLVEILEDKELTELNEQNSCSELNGVRVKDQSLSHQQAGSLSHNENDDSVEAQNTVDGINLLLDRINTQ